MVGLFFSQLQLHTAQHFIKIFPIRDELGDLFIKLFGMVFMFDVSQFVNDDVINQVSVIFCVGSVDCRVGARN